MSKYLIKVTEQYRADTEGEAKQLIEEAKTAKGFTLVKYTSESKCTKAKGEIVDEWQRVVLVKEFCTEKEPDVTASVSYNIQDGAFPIIESEYDNSEESDF